MKQKSPNTLYGYWNELRAGRMAPRSLEVEPARIASILSETSMLARVNAAVVSHRGRDLEQSLSAVDLFYTVLDGLIVAEQLGGDELAKSAAVLFNKAIAQIDQFEPAAGVA